MQKEIMELEKILEQEIDACSKLEQYICDKKDYLIKGDIKGIIEVDSKLETYNSAIEKLEEKRQELYPDKSSLREIIAGVEEKSRADYLESLRKKLSELLVNSQKQNNINAELIKHSLTIIESSITSIVNALVPENSYYNSQGKTIKDESSQSISSVIHEA